MTAATQTIIESATAAGSAKASSILELSPWQVPDEVRAEFRRTAAVLSSIKNGTFNVAVCSAVPGEGVTWVSAMLGCALAERGRQVILADTSNESDLRRAFEAREAPGGLSRPGLNEFLICQTGSPNLSVVVPGEPRTMSSESWVGAIASLRSFAPAVLVDCGSLAQSPKLFHLSPTLDGVLLVVEAERERRDSVAASLKTMRAAGVHVLGVVLNKRRQHSPSLIRKLI